MTRQEGKQKSVKNDQSGTRQEGKKDPAYIRQERTGKAGKRSAYIGKKLVYIKQAGKQEGNTSG